MAVLIEAYSVIIQRASIALRVPGGWGAFLAIVPNGTLCYDDYLVRVGFMDQRDVKTFVDLLERHGLRFFDGTEAVDIAVVDQREGPTCQCQWSTFLHVESFKLGGSLAVCRHVLDLTEGVQISCPAGWRYEQSLSKHYSFAPGSFASAGLRFLRREGNCDVYWNAFTEREVYVGRAHS